MENSHNEQLQLLTADELRLRLGRVKDYLRESGLDSALICDNANVYYLTGRVYRGFLYISTADSEPAYFPRRPANLKGRRTFNIRKVEEIPAIISATAGITPPTTMGLEYDIIPFSAVTRVQKAFESVATGNASAAMRRARSVKTEAEQQLMRTSGEKQTRAYSKIPGLYKEGMTDVEFQIEIERVLRLEGCLGQFRVSGADMEIYMGNVLTGDNADNPSPYDFAMGGAGMSTSLPVGADGTAIVKDKPIMVDVNGNFTGHMTDMTRTYCPGTPSQEAVNAHETSIAICHAIAEAGRPGTAASALYELALSIATEAGLAEYFMGHRYHAGFVGHGVGIEINEMPVIAPRSRDILEAGNTIAIEPKFVIPGVGAVGIENTYIVRENGPMELITTAPEPITALN